MENKILIKSGLKHGKGSFAGICFLLFMVAITLSTVLTLWSNAASYIQTEIDRAGFGSITAWVSDVGDMEALQESIATLDLVERVESQDLIYAEYEVNNQESDSEGQLIVYRPEENRYRFLEEDLSGYEQAPDKIISGQVYVSPSLVSMMEVRIGQKIEFPIGRNGVHLDLTVAGYYEDPFMGSSMIGMKGFLISETDQNTILQTIRENKMEALAREGAMLHIFAEDKDTVTAVQLNESLNDKTELPIYTEFVHSNNAIFEFMLILQNIFCGLFLAFALVLLGIAMVVIGHSISAVIDQEYKNLGILKTVGMTTKGLVRIHVFQYLAAIFPGMFLGILLSIPLGEVVSKTTITTTGILIPNALPLLLCILCFTTVAALLIVFMMIKLKKLEQITPMNAIGGYANGEPAKKWFKNPIHGNRLRVSLALRQLMAGKYRYISACMVAILLVFFASFVGRMDSWLGSDGKGLMDAFNPADHDMGVQTLGNLTPEAAENMVLSYTGITDSYRLAMPDVSVNGVNYTANVITEPNRFHIIQGKTSAGEEEVVLTQSAALDLGVSIGDRVWVRGDKGISEYTVSGIYQCANDMGNNIGMSREGYLKIGQEDIYLWCSHYFLEDPSLKQEITKGLEEAFAGDVHIHENSWPGLFGIIGAMKILIVFMYGMVVLFVFIVTSMTAGRILAAEQKDMGIYKALGISTMQLRFTFSLRFAMTAGMGSVLGTLLAAVFTDPLVSAVMKRAGISNFTSAANFQTVLLPGIAVVLLFTVFAYLGSGKIKTSDMAVLAAE